MAVARGILAQLLHQDEGILSYLYDKCSRSGQNRLSTDALAKELLETVIRNYEKLYVVIDGIDECDREQRRDIVSTFETCWESLPPDDADSLRCLFTSQDDSAARKDFAKMVSIKITENDTKRDIRTYAIHRSSEIQAKFSLTEERRQYVEDMITEKAEGDNLHGL